MNAHQVGPDPDARKVRLVLVGLLVVVGLLLLAGVGHADAAPVGGGGCTGYTWAQGTVVGFRPGLTRNVVVVRVGSDFGARYTLEHWELGQRVLVSGTACDGWFGIYLRVRRG